MPIITSITGDMEDASDDLSIVYINTVAKPQFNAKNENDNKDYPYYEVISFDAGPILFSSINFLYPGEKIYLNDEYGSEIEFKSETSTELNGSSLEVFSRVVESDGSMKYIRLSIADDGNRTLVFVNNNSENSGTLIDTIIISTSINVLSFFILRSKNNREFNSRWDLAKPGPLYHGDNILDTVTNVFKNITIDTKHDEDVLNKYILDGLAESERTTFIQLVDKLYMDELLRSNESKTLNGLIKSFIETGVVDDFDKFLALIERYLYYDGNMYLYNMEPELLSSLSTFCYDNIVYNSDNHHYKLLKLLLLDSNISYSLMKDKRMANDLVLKLTGKKHINWIEREYTLSLLADLLLNPLCVRLFITFENDKSLYDTFVYGISSDPHYSNDKLYETLTEIGNRVMIYSSLSELETLYNEMSSDRFRIDAKVCDSILLLSDVLNNIIDNMDKLYTRPYNPQMKYSKSIYHYIILYIKDTKFCNALEYLLKSIRYILSNFPSTSFNFYRMINKPFKFILKYVNYFDLTSLLVEMYSISKLLLDTYLDVESTIRKGFPYDGTHSRAFAERLYDKTCHHLIHIKIIKLVSYFISNYPSNETIETVTAICKTAGYNQLCTVLSNDIISTNIIRLLNLTLDELRAERALKTDLHLLLNLLSSAVIKSGGVLYNIGRRLIFVLEGYLEICSDSDSKLIVNVLHTLRIIFTCSSAALEDIDLPDDLLLINYIDDFLKDLIKATDTNVLNIDLKQPIDCGYFIKNMTSIPKDYYSLYLADKTTANIKGSFICDRFKAPFTDDVVDLLDMDWKLTHNKISLGITDDQFNYYSSINLYTLPPDALPAEISHGLSLLQYLGTITSYASTFASLFTKRNMESLLRLWAHSIASLSPDFDTILNVEMNVFSSLLGYQWYTSRKGAISIIKSILDIIYLSLRHFSNDEIDSNVKGADIYYVNDDIMKMLILTATDVIRGYDNECINSITKLTNYWYNRFRKSQGYILNYLSSSYLTLPKMANGVLLLLVSCFDEKNQSLPSIPHIDIELDNDSEGPNKIKVDIEDRLYQISYNEKKSENDRAVNVDMRLFINFLCMVIKRRYTMDPAMLIMNASVLYIMIINEVPMLDLLSKLDEHLYDSNNMDELDVDKVYKLVACYTGLINKCNSSNTIRTEMMYKINVHVLKCFDKLCKLGLTAFSRLLLFEGYLEVFKLHNRLWNKDLSTLISIKNFYLYIHMINTSVVWICNSLNEIELDSNDSTVDVVLLGFMALYHAFEIPFTTLNILYTVEQSQMELIFKSIKKKAEPDIIKVSSHNVLWLHKIINKLCEFVASNINNFILYNYVLILNILYEICKSIHNTGKSQDYFIFELIQGCSSNKGDSTKSDNSSADSSRKNVFDEILCSLNKIIDNTDIINKSIIISIISMNSCYETLSGEIIRDVMEWEVPKSIPGYIFLKKRSQDNVLKFFSSNADNSNVKKIKSYINWNKWMEITYKTSEHYGTTTMKWPFAYDGSSECIGLAKLRNAKDELIFMEDTTKTEDNQPQDRENGVKYPEKGISRVPPSHSDELESAQAVVNETQILTKISPITPKQWQEFDNDLSINGLDVHSIIINPSMLKERNFKDVFLSILSKHKTIYNHLISVGIDVRY